jgi:predicted nucleic acid-binding Zn ribbon protein
MTNKNATSCHRYGCRKQALRKFCSDACRIAHHNSQRLPADKIKVTCQGCGSVFQGRPDQKSCSATCRSRLFRAKQRSEALFTHGSHTSSVDWGESTPFSPAELRQRMQKQRLQPGVEYSWLPPKPRKVVVRRATRNQDQLDLNFFEDV